MFPPADRTRSLPPLQPSFHERYGERDESTYSLIVIILRTSTSHASASSLSSSSLFSPLVDLCGGGGGREGFTFPRWKWFCSRTWVQLCFRAGCNFDSAGTTVGISSLSSDPRLWLSIVASYRNLSTAWQAYSVLGRTLILAGGVECMPAAVPLWPIVMLRTRDGEVAVGARSRTLLQDWRRVGFLPA